MEATRVGAEFVRQRLQWSSYGFIAGILIGVVLGVIFHGVIGAVISFLLVAALLIPVVLAVMFWRKVKGERPADVAPAPVAHDPSLSPGQTIETTYTISDRAESRER